MLIYTPVKSANERKNLQVQMNIQSDAFKSAAPFDLFFIFIAGNNN